MPLKPGKSHEVVSHNIREMVKAGHPVKQAVAAALANKRKYKKMAQGGLVNADFDAAGTPEAIDSGDEDKMMSSKPAAGHLMSYREDEPMHDDEQRSLTEIDKDGDYHPSEVANPMEMEEAEGFAEALHRKAMESMSPENYAMGGLVDDPSEMHDKLGTKPSENMKDSIEEPGANMHSGEADLEHAVRHDSVMGSPKPPKDHGLSEEVMEAIRNKKMKRRYPIV